MNSILNKNIFRKGRFFGQINNNKIISAEKQYYVRNIFVTIKNFLHTNL